MKINLLVFCLVFFSLTIETIYSATTKVGNADDGRDLEGGIAISSGPIIEARKQAVNLLSKLNVSGISGLGLLKAEVQKSQAYLATRNVKALSQLEKVAPHTNAEGLVYARTFAQAHASTRFFPVALELNQAALISLHIHEGLHRALKSPYNTNEEIVSKLTLAITSPGSTHDLIKKVAAEVFSDPSKIENSKFTMTKEFFNQMPSEQDHYKNPSRVYYQYQQFFSPNQPTSYKIARMHTVRSLLFPFGSYFAPFGLGIGMSFIQGPTGHRSGPLELSAQSKLWSPRGFDIGLKASVALNTLSAAELKNSPFGRDIYNFGVTINRVTPKFFVKNFLGLTLGGEATQKVGNIDYAYEYGKVIEAVIQAGIKVGNFKIGGFGQIHLADFLKVNSTAFSFDSGRYRILSAGPQITWVNEDFEWSIHGRFLVDSTKEANFDYLGNVMGTGVSQGNIGTSFRYFF